MGLLPLLALPHDQGRLEEGKAPLLPPGDQLVLQDVFAYQSEDQSCTAYTVVLKHEADYIAFRLRNLSGVEVPWTDLASGITISIDLAFNTEEGF